MSSVCGIDFGTSNSTIGVLSGGQPHLVGLAEERAETPSAIFFDDDTPQPLFGDRAVAAYVSGGEGRFMRALKSILGSSLVNETTVIKGNRIPFAHVIGMFIQNITRQAELALGNDLDCAVMGRPVHFVDGNPEADQRAEDMLRGILQSIGFKDVQFQYEPIAAALAYEQQIEAEELALIMDIGGGTSDFSIIRVSPEGRKRVDRKGDILANDGVHIGGTDFDRRLSLEAIMPHLGYRSIIRDKMNTQDLEIPSSLFHDLSKWHKIHFLYDAKTLALVEDLHGRSKQPDLIERLLDVLYERNGHSLAFLAERAKIELTASASCRLQAEQIDAGWELAYSRAQFEAQIMGDVEELKRTIARTIAAAGVRSDQVSSVFLTGGSTRIPLVQAIIPSALPNARVVTGDLFGSVGLGLTLAAARYWA